MENACAPFEGKKITLMGLGLLGRGGGDAEFLAKCGAQVIATDKKTEAELAESVAQLKNYPNIAFHLGGHRIEDFTSADMVIKAAGVPLDSPEIAAARKAGVEIVMSTALFAKYAMEAGATIVGVTGTRGKSTVSHMIHWALSETADPSTVHLGGNVRGVSTLAMLPDIKKGDIVVLELDSWQLQGFGDLGISPDIAVFTNLMPDHLNYYGGDMEKYFADKASIFRFQKEGDSLIVGTSIAEKIRGSHPPVGPLVPEPIPEEWELKIPGEHNRENASLAAATLRALGVEDEEIWASLTSFEGVEGRLQFVREVKGVKIYNDNNATTPEATIVGLKALGECVTLIIGGSDKQLSLEELVSEIKKRVSHVILLTHPHYAGSARLAEALKARGIPYDEAGNLSSALATAMQSAKGHALLFSPAFASFGMFKNEYERNDQFLRIVGAL